MSNFFVCLVLFMVGFLYGRFKSQKYGRVMNRVRTETSLLALCYSLEESSQHTCARQAYTEKLLSKYFGIIEKLRAVL